MNEEKLDLILQELKQMEQSHTAFDSKITNSIDEMKSRLDSIENKLTASYDQIAKNAENISEIKDTVHHISRIQSKQEDTINILARRSIDQEEAIKRAK